MAKKEKRLAISYQDKNKDKRTLPTYTEKKQATKKVNKPNNTVTKQQNNVQTNDARTQKTTVKRTTQTNTNNVVETRPNTVKPSLGNNDVRTQKLDFQNKNEENKFTPQQKEVTKRVDKKTVENKYDEVNKALDQELKDKANITALKRQKYEKARSKAMKEEGVDARVKFDNLQEKTINYNTKKEDATHKLKPIDYSKVEEKTKNERNELNSALNDERYVQYVKDEVKAQTEPVTLAEKTIGVPVRATQDLFSTALSGEKYRDPNTGQEYFLPSYSDLRQEKVSNSYNTGIGKFLGDTAYNTTKIGEAALLDAVTMGYGGKALYWSDMAADNYKNAINRGYSREQALANTAVSTGTEFLTEKFLGGLSKTLTGGKASGVQNLVGNMVNKVIKNPRVANIIGSMGSEGLEEFVQEYIDQWNELATLKNSKNVKDYLDVLLDPDVFMSALYSGAVGAGSGGAMTGSQRALGIDTEGIEAERNIEKNNQLRETLEEKLKKTKDKELKQKYQDVIGAIDEYNKRPFGNTTENIDNNMLELNLKENEVGLINNMLENGTATEDEVVQMLREYAQIKQNNHDAELVNTEEEQQRLQDQAQQVANVREQVQNKKLTYEQGKQALQEIQEGTFRQNMMYENIAQREFDKIQRDLKNGKITEADATNRIQALAQTLEQQKGMSNNEVVENGNISNNNDNIIPDTNEVREVKPTNTSDKIQNFRNSIENENVEDADGFYKSVEKIIKDKDYNVVLDSSITNEKGQSVNALISNENGVTIKINPKSERAGEILLMHEVTHGIETKEMRDLIMNYASKNSEFNSALEDLKRTYGTQDVTPEVVADISGQLFGNQEFISNLSVEKPSVFRKIYNKIIEMANKITGNSKEALFVRDLKNKWEKVYRESTIETSQQNIKNTVKYSQNAEITDNKGRKLDKQQQEYFKDTKVVDNEGHLITVYHTNKYTDLPFFEFKPQVALDYHNDLFGNQTVIYFTDSKEMSGSYADQDYIMADTRKYTKTEEVEEFLNELNNINARKGDVWKLKDVSNDPAYTKTYRDAELNFDYSSGTYEEAIEKRYKRGLLTKEQYELGAKGVKYVIELNDEGPDTTYNFVPFTSKEDLFKNFRNKLSKKIYQHNKSQKRFGEAKYQYEGYVNLTNPYEIDAEGRNWNNITREIKQEFKDTIDNMSEDEMDNLSDLAMESLTKYNEWHQGEKYSEYLKYEDVYKTLDKINSENLVMLSMKASLGKEVTANDYREMYDAFGGIGKDPDRIIEVDGKEMTFAEFAAKWSNLDVENAKYYKNYSYFLEKMPRKYREKIINVGDFYKAAKYNFQEFAINDYLSKRMETNDVVHKVIEMNQNGSNYDGVIIRNTTDYGGYSEERGPHDLFIAFNSNQFKAFDNKTPTSDQDIRYSQKVKKWQDFLDKYFKERGTTTRLKTKETKKQGPALANATKQETKIVKKEQTKVTKKEQNVKTKKGPITMDDAIKAFNRAKRFGTEVQNKAVQTFDKAMGENNPLTKEQMDKIRHDVHTNKATVEKAKTNLSGLTFEQKYERATQKLNSNKAINEVDVAEVIDTLVETVERGTPEQVLNLLQDYSIMETEAGRVVQAASLLRKMSPVGQLAMLNKIVARQQKLGNKKWAGVKLNQDLVQKVLDTYENKEQTKWNQVEMEEAVDELKQDIANQLKMTISDKVNAWRYLSMLGNPKTHIRNVVANTVMSVVKGGADKLSGGLQDVFIKDGKYRLTGKEAVKTRTAKSSTKEVKQFSKLAFEEMKPKLSGNKYDNTRGIEAMRSPFDNKVLKKLDELNSGLLNIEDLKAKETNFKKSFANFLTAQGIKTNEDINNNPDIIDAAKNFALQEANIATFNQDNKLATYLNKLDNLGPVAKVLRGAIIPFTRTPLNIAKTGIEYTPVLGTLTTLNDLKKVDSSMKGVVLINGLSKQTVGAGLLVMGYMLAKSGVLTADSGDDKDDKFEKDQGAKMDFSLRLPASIVGEGASKVSLDLSWLSPSSMPLLVGAAMHEQFSKHEGINEDMIIESLAGVLDPLSEMSCISSFTDVLDSYSKTSAGKFMGIAKSTSQNYISQFIPTVSGQIAKVFDTNKRSTYADKSSSHQFSQETIRKLMFKIPGLRNMLPEQTDYLGENKKEINNMAIRALDAFFNPMNHKVDTMSRESKELIRLYDKTGNDAVLPSNPNAYINYNDTQYTMTQKEFNKYKRDFGEAAKKNLKEVMDSDEYKSASDDEKADMIEGVMKYSKDVAKDNFLTSKGENYVKVNEDGEETHYESDNVNEITQATNYSIADYYITKTVTPNLLEGNLETKKKKLGMVSEFGFDAKTYNQYLEDINDIKADTYANGKTIRNSRKRKIVEYLNSLELTPLQRAMLLKQSYKSYRSYDGEIINAIRNSNLSDEDRNMYGQWFNLK